LPRNASRPVAASRAKTTTRESLPVESST
jgi:hypothetical protein